MKIKHFSSPLIVTWILVACFGLFTLLSWVLVFRDPRALIGIGNLYPELKDTLFPIQTLLTGYGLNSVPTILFGITAFIAIVCYIWSLNHKISLKNTILFAIIFQFITFLSFPILSTDIFSYIFSERVSTVHHENVWQVTPASFPDDQFGVLADWKDTTSIYGAMHYLVYLGPSLIGQENLLLLVILYKLVPTVFACGTLYILYRLLLQTKHHDPEKMIRLVFWNPLFVLEIFGSAHNDSMMIFFAIFGLYLFYKKAWFYSSVMLALAFQVKLIPVVLFFFCFTFLIQKRNFQAAVLFVTGFVSINALLFFSMQVNIFEYIKRVAYNGGVYWQSLPNVVQTFYPGQSGFIVILFLLWTCVFTLFQWRKKVDPVLSYICVILVYIVFVSSAYWNWYVLWIFPFVPFIKDKKLSVVILVLTFTSLFAYPLLWIIHRINTPSVFWPVLTYALLVGPSIIIYLFAKFQEKRFTALLRLLRIDNLIAEKVSS